MIRLENISKQNGKQILFIEASAALLRGEKIGLVAENGGGEVGATQRPRSAGRRANRKSGDYFF